MELAREAYGFSRKTRYKAVARAEATRKEELERAKAEYDMSLDPPPDACPELAEVWAAQKRLWLIGKEKFRKGEWDHPPKTTIRILKSDATPVPCPECGALARSKEGKKVSCGRCGRELARPYWPSW
jgi:hypothetical protein